MVGACARYQYRNVPNASPRVASSADQRSTRRATVLCTNTRPNQPYRRLAIATAFL
jgi:hypothetical protein